MKSESVLQMYYIIRYILLYYFYLSIFIYVFFFYPICRFSCVTVGCERESSVSMWIYVFLGNVLRGIGETPVQPLGISYIDDYAQSENAALYIGNVAFLRTVY